ncbi:MAG: cobalt-precorrin-6A reductase, partial [Gammaproteobacteria bacterium]
PVTSLAGRTRTPGAIAGRVRSGGFGGVAGLRAYLKERRYAAVVDATHPFAARISASAAEACQHTGVPRVALYRAPWRPGAGDCWHDVANADEAAARLGALVPPPLRVFLALGQRGLEAFANPAFAHLAPMSFVLRAVEPPAVPAGLVHRVVLGKGPFELEAELELLRRHRIEAVVARNSGGPGAYAKLLAARELRLPVVLLSRPAPPPRPRVESVAAALDWLRATVAY